MQETRIVLAVVLGILLLLFVQTMIHFMLLQRRVLMLHERLERLEQLVVGDSVRVLDESFFVD